MNVRSIEKLKSMDNLLSLEAHQLTDALRKKAKGRAILILDAFDTARHRGYDTSARGALRALETEL